MRALGHAPILADRASCRRRPGSRVGAGAAPPHVRDRLDPRPLGLDSLHPHGHLPATPASVFDTSARPWVDLGGAGADAVADAVGRCPTGALRYERLDGA